MIRKNAAILLFFSLLAALFAGCGAKPVTIEPELYPASGGSALTAALGRGTMCALTGLTPEEAIPALLHTDDESAYRSLLSGESRLIFVASEPTASLKTSAEAQGVSFELTPVARDALVFFVNAENPIKSLTKSDLARIYRGDVTDWRTLSGDHCSIDAYRNAYDDFYTLMLSEEIMGGELPVGGPGEAFLAFADDPLLYDLADERAAERPAPYRNTAGAIAYGSRFLIAGSEKERGIRLLSLNGAAPTAENLTDGRYELTYDIFAVIRSDAAPESAERSVVSWLTSRDGRQVIKEAGYAPIK